MTNKFLRRPDVEMMTGLSRSSIYAMMTSNEFPRPVRLGRRAVAWREADITTWMDNRSIALPSHTLHAANGDGQ